MRPHASRYAPCIDAPPLNNLLTRPSQIIVVGAGLGGVGSAIALLLAGHSVTILEAAAQIAEVGAGIQVLPNSSRVLQEWGLRDMLDRYATEPSHVNMLGWKGNLISRMSTAESAAPYPGTVYWDFHRANLHKCLVERAVELGAKLEVNKKVSDVRPREDGATVVLEGGEEWRADLVVGADGIASRLREIMVGKPDPPTLTGDLAYRLLLKTEDMKKDPELRSFIETPQVNYWLGPDAHAVNYVLRGGELFNMVLLVPDDMPEGVNVTPGNVAEVRRQPSIWKQNP